MGRLKYHTDEERRAAHLEQMRQWRLKQAHKRRQEKKNKIGLWERWQMKEALVLSEDGYWYDVKGNKYILSPTPIKKKTSEIL